LSSSVYRTKIAYIVENNAFDRGIRNKVWLMFVSSGVSCSRILFLLNYHLFKF